MKASSPKRVLIVDDEDAILSILRTLFSYEGWEVHSASGGAAGIELLGNCPFDVVLTDLKMPGVDGLEVLRAVKEIQPDAEIILMTGYGSVDSAIEAMRAGAFHYIVKPFRPQEVIHLADKACEQRFLRRENRFLKTEGQGEYHLQSIIGTSEATQKTVAALLRLADTDAPILLSGERGSGREFLARALHFRSGRSGELFVPVRCSGVSDKSLESDLFGYTAGAYPEALLPRSGKMDLANHGTIFLSDIDQAGPRVTEQLRQVLASRTITPVGGSVATQIDVRIVASCSPGIDEKVRQGLFPSELREMFRPGDISVPALRERPEDIPLFLHQALAEANKPRKKPLEGFTEAVMASLVAHPWPGNLLELRTLVFHTAAKKRHGALIDSVDIPPENLRRKTSVHFKEGEGTDTPTADGKDDIYAGEKLMILQALALSNGDVGEASRLLNVDVNGTEMLMRRYGIRRIVEE